MGGVRTGGRGGRGEDRWEGGWEGWGQVGGGVGVGGRGGEGERLYSCVIAASLSEARTHSQLGYHQL